MDGSSESNLYIDSSVGALVWVRRRNGSWWPGRILGAEELPGSHLLSPRTGTPVKLLGREDGSVDWYNIEKSRRVKAFRCGDFEECIERAKALASVLTKKREKYARREDAILHALELERKYAEQNQLLGSGFSVERNYHELDFEDDMVLDDDIDGINPPSDFHSDFIDPEEPADVVQESLDSLFSLQGDRRFMDADWEDDIAETIPRMRGLQDFGLKIAPSQERRASWVEHFPSACMTEDDTKMVSCITKNTTACQAPVNTKATGMVTGPSKRKRPSQINAVEDESAYKKRDRRRPLNRVLESSVKHTDVSVNLGSKAAPSVSMAERNGYAHIQPKMEPYFQGPSELRCLTGRTNLGMWQVESRSKHEMFDSQAVMDKECSSFSDHVKSNCCEGRAYPCVSSQIESNPLSFVDSFLQGGSGLRCSFFQGSTYSGADAGFERANSLPMAENLSGPLSEFTAWPNYSHREMLSENEFGLRGHITGSRPISMADYPFDTAVPNNGLPMYSLYGNKLEENSVFGKRIPYDGVGSFNFSRSNVNSDTVKAAIKSSRLCLSGEAEDVDGGRRMKREDEADSFQPIPGSSLCSPKGVAVRDCTGHWKPRSASSGLPSFYDANGMDEAARESSSHDFDPEMNMNDFSDDDTGACDYLNSDLQFTECEVDDGHALFKWQAKGKRRTRSRCGSSWGLTPACMLSKYADEVEDKEDQSCIPSVGVEVRSVRELKHIVEAGSSSEDVEEFLVVASNAEHLDYEVNGDIGTIGNEKALDLLEVQKSTWIDVPVEIQVTDTQIPFVSLISKLNGRAIMGHAVVVEVINKRYGYAPNGASRSLAGNAVKKPPLQPMWRTARRTAMQRVPRSCRVVFYSDHGEDACDKHHQRGISSNSNRTNGKPGPPLPSDRRRFLKKVGSAPQKTRMLSSIAVQHSQRDIDPITSKVTDPSVVTCIPVNVIFNRIREVLYRGMSHSASDSDNNV